jgi:DNA-binding CsgD family transcriptional regulator/tetratricopeptide (TPR) repeat protein
VKLPFTGRADILDRLLDRYYRAQCGDGGAVLLRGEAGIGKTRLIERFLELTGPEGKHVVVTAALDYASSPLAPIVKIVETWLQTRSALFSEHAGLRSAVDLVCKVDGQDAPPSTAERRRCFDAIAQLFRFASADAPTTIVVDDLHFADHATVHLLYHILVATRKSPLFLVAAARPDIATDAGHPSPISRLERLDGVSSFIINPLSPDACDQMIVTASKGRIGRKARLRIQERAEGNPLFVEELVHESLATGRTSIAGVPATIFETVLERFSLLSPAGRNMLRIAAVVGRTFDGEVVGRIAGCSFNDLLGDIRHAVDLGLIDQTERARFFRFRHAMTHDAIYGTLLLAERQAMHHSVFAELLKQTESVETIAVLAFHAYASDDCEAASHYNERAGDYAAANQAFESAIVFYEHALQALGHEAARAAELCRKLANAQLLAGYPDLAVHSVGIALEKYRERESLADIADALLQLADIAAQTGDDERRLEILAEASAVLSDTKDPQLSAKRALCRFELAIADRDIETVIDGCALLLNSDRVDATIKVSLQNARANALLMQRRYDEAVLAQADAVRLADRTRSDGLASGVRFALGAVLALSGKLGPASTSFEESATFARRRWATTDSAISAAFQAEMELIVGNSLRARELLEGVLEVASRSDHPLLITMIGRVGIFLGVRIDDLPFIRRIVNALDLESLLHDHTPGRLIQLSGAFAQFLTIDGRPEEAAAVLGRAVQRLSAKRLKSSDWSPCTMITIAAIGESDDIPKARIPIRDWFTPYAPAFLDLFDAFVAARLGDGEKAAMHGDRAAACFHAFQFRYEEASALSIAGRKHEAIAIFDEVGACGTAQRLREELTPKNRQGRAANRLTPREDDVAMLVIDGLTNREIADRLSVTEKTVETHLASIFGKLGIRSRSQLELRLLSGAAT